MKKRKGKQNKIPNSSAQTLKLLLSKSFHTLEKSVAFIASLFAVIGFILGYGALLPSVVVTISKDQKNTEKILERKILIKNNSVFRLENVGFYLRIIDSETTTGGSVKDSMASNPIIQIGDIERGDGEEAEEYLSDYFNSIVSFGGYDSYKSAYICVMIDFKYAIPTFSSTPIFRGFFFDKRKGVNEWRESASLCNQNVKNALKKK
jgi:hypothetical protein